MLFPGRIVFLRLSGLEDTEMVSSNEIRRFFKTTGP